MDPDNSFKERMAARMAELPKVVRDAIVSADVEKHLRELADKHKLHLDQWTLLENEVTLALLGFQKAEDLPANIKNEVGTTEEVANALALDISDTVFQPIREELERELEHPDAKAATQTGTEQMRTQMLAENKAANPLQAAPVAPVAPATPPPAPPTEKVERAQLPESYQAATPSHERKTVDGDPYREPIV